MTRAEPGASRTAGRLAALGFEAVLAPLLEIRSLPVVAPDLEGISALAFTSVNGVTAFSTLTPRRSHPVFAVGDATAAAARAEGFDVVRSAAGALGDLADLLRAEASGRVLVPGAQEPAGDLPALLAGSPIEAIPFPVYEAVETGAPAPTAFDAVLAHSPRGALALAGHGADAMRGRLVIAISTAAAAPLAGLGFREIRVAAQPTENGMMEALGNPARAV